MSAIAYMVLRTNIITNHEKDTKILFYKIQTQTSELLSNLLHQYTQEKKHLLDKHAQVLQYLKAHDKKPLKIDLNEIHTLINKDKVDKPYNIYLTDQKLVIQNSTFKKDIGFDLSFALPSFTRHYEQKITGICTPLFEKSSKQFLSYTDSYLSRNKEDGVLQISYTYNDSKKRLLEIQKLIGQYTSIVDAKAYIIVDTGFVNDIILKDFLSYKPDLKEISARIKAGSEVNDKLKDKNLIIDKFKENETSYTTIYLATASAIFDDTKIIYSISLDETLLEDKLYTLNISIALVILLALVALFVMIRIRKKEIKFSEQDKFVQSSMHEIKTPLAIITLNNELRELEFGKDEYSLEIDSAIKLLKTSYDDMSFTITKDELDYPKQMISLANVVQERVDYFKTIAKSNAKTIKAKIEGHCILQIAMVELIRLIDNNLSNAIKYSDVSSTITVKLNENVLSIHNSGAPIKDTKQVFNKYFRENSVVGGHGLGLSIVKEITKKYAIDFELTSKTDSGTTFSYIFKCHTNDI